MSLFLRPLAAVRAHRRYAAERAQRPTRTERRFIRVLSMVVLAAAALAPAAAGVDTLGFAAPGLAASPPELSAIALPQDDIDAFMEQVMAKRELNWEATYDYVFNEIERFRIRGYEIAALQSFDQEYTWYVRDGYLVRSPWSINGVEVDKETREQAELEWIEDVKDDESDERIQRDNFFDFNFEPGNYLFAGREMFEGQEVVKIEYYPTESFFDEDDEDDEDDETAEERERREQRRRERDEDDEWDDEEFEHMFAKTSLVTMLVLPDDHQIVKWTFENVGFEFLPYRWLFRMDEIRVSMVMDQPIEDVWLPREIAATARASTASFNLEIEYSTEFGEYKEPAVGGGVVFGRPKR